MQEEDIYDWETWHETANGIMGHKFSERVEIRSNMQTGLIRIFKDGDEVSRIDGTGMLLGEYERLLVRTAKEARQLQVINN